MAKLKIEHIKGNTYYIPSPSNVGIYVEDGRAILIDSGNDKEAGKQILRLLDEQGWELEAIINTHSNADHIGGNAYLQDKTNCRVLATRMESAFINDPVLEPAFLFGGFPMKDLHNKFLTARPSIVTSVISSSGRIEGTALEAIPLPGHFFDMIGIMTPDKVFFIADSLFPENIINKYHLFVLVDINSHMETLERLRTLEADVYVPSHGERTEDLGKLIEVNQAKIEEIAGFILDKCLPACTFEEILQKVCLEYNVQLNPTQYVLVASTLKAFLVYLYERQELAFKFDEGKMLWESRR